MDKIQVSIRCFAYNHERFIRQCLDGFVMQKTDFRFEAIVHDDASTDNTAAIIREYAEKYPDIIKPIYETENQYSKHDGSLTRIMNAHTRGKYVAMCEGDDYWTDPYKLQKQVDFLESHPDYVMCSHLFDVYNERNKQLQKNDESSFTGKSYDLDTLINGEWYFQPLTVLFRFDAYDREHFASYGLSMDVILYYELLRRGGKGYCLPDVMAVYRIHDGGVWSLKSLDKQRAMEFQARLAIYRVEKSDKAAKFLLSQFTRIISRRWMMRNVSMFVTVFKILAKHFGRMFALRLFLDRLLFAKYYDANVGCKE